MRELAFATFALSLALALAPLARAGELEDATALARRVAEAHRSDEHRARFEIVFPEASRVPRSGSVRVEARSGRFAIEEEGFTLDAGESGARIVVARRTHVPTFAARASGKRDESALEEAILDPASGRVALVACALLAGARERSRGAPESLGVGPGPGKPDAPDAELSPDLEDEWPRLVVAVESRRSRRRGPYAELARRVLEEVARAHGLAAPADPLGACRRLERDLADPDAAPRAAFLLGEWGSVEARPGLAKLGFQEATDASAKLGALVSEHPVADLYGLSATGGSWDVRAWARERLEASPATRGSWAWELVAGKETKPGDDALVEGLRALPPPAREGQRARVAALLDDARPLVRVAAAAALLRWEDLPRAREVLLAVARDGRADPDAREDAIARLAAVELPSELARALGPVLAAPDDPARVRAQVARAFDESEDVAAAEPLASALEAEIDRASRAGAAAPGDARDLRVALTQALATVASVSSDATSEDAKAATAALALASAAEPDDELRALAIHAVGSLPEDRGRARVKDALEAERKRERTAPAALRAAEMEVAAASAADDGARLEAIADAACEAPLRSTLDRLVRAARDPRARAVLVERLKARGPLGDVGLATLEKN